MQKPESLCPRLSLEGTERALSALQNQMSSTISHCSKAVGLAFSHIQRHLPRSRPFRTGSWQHRQHMPPRWQETLIGPAISDRRNRDAIDIQVDDHIITKVRDSPYD